MEKIPSHTGSPHFSKWDILSALIIGEAVAWLLFILVRVNAPELPIPAGLAETLNSLSTALALAVVLPVLSVVGLYVAFWASKMVKIAYQAAKFALVGALNTFIDFGVFNFLILTTDIFSGPWTKVFKGGSFVVAVVNSYVWNKYWTFNDREGEVAKEFSQFFIVSVVGFVINVGAFALVADIIGPQFGLSQILWNNVAVLFATFAALGWNFIGYKFWVFK